MGEMVGEEVSGVEGVPGVEGKSDGVWPTGVASGEKVGEWVPGVEGKSPGEASGADPDCRLTNSPRFHLLRDWSQRAIVSCDATTVGVMVTSPAISSRACLASSLSTGYSARMSTKALAASTASRAVCMTVSMCLMLTLRSRASTMAVGMLFRSDTRLAREAFRSTMS